MTVIVVLVPKEPPDFFSVLSIPVAKSRPCRSHWGTQQGLRDLGTLVEFPGEGGTGHPAKDEPCLR